jgi:hypothetical protein
MTALTYKVLRVHPSTELPDLAPLLRDVSDLLGWLLQVFLAQDDVAGGDVAVLAGSVIERALS